MISLQIQVLTQNLGIRMFLLTYRSSKYVMEIETNGNKEFTLLTIMIHYFHTFIYTLINSFISFFPIYPFRLINIFVSFTTI